MARLDENRPLAFLLDCSVRKVKVNVRFGSASADGYTQLNLRQVHRACSDDSAFGNEFAKPFLAHDDDVRGRPCAKLYRNGIGSIALRREVLCRNCNPAALLKAGTRT